MQKANNAKGCDFWVIWIMLKKSQEEKEKAWEWRRRPILLSNRIGARSCSPRTWNQFWALFNTRTPFWVWVCVVLAEGSGLDHSSPNSLAGWPHEEGWGLLLPHLAVIVSVHSELLVAKRSGKGKCGPKLKPALPLSCPARQDLSGHRVLSSQGWGMGGTCGPFGGLICCSCYPCFQVLPIWFRLGRKAKVKLFPIEISEA